MKVMRFMSLAEFNKYLTGEVLQNYEDHKARTDAIGFCFLDADEYGANDAYHFLSGVVSSEICAIFEVPDHTPFKHGTGQFADPAARALSIMEAMFNTDTIDVKEYSITEYSDKQFKLVQYCDNFAWNFSEESFDRIFDWQPAGKVAA